MSTKIAIRLYTNISFPLFADSVANRLLDMGTAMTSMATTLEKVIASNAECNSLCFHCFHTMSCDFRQNLIWPSKFHAVWDFHYHWTTKVWGNEHVPLWWLLRDGRKTTQCVGVARQEAQQLRRVVLPLILELQGNTGSFSAIMWTVSEPYRPVVRFSVHLCVLSRTPTWDPRVLFSQLECSLESRSL